MHSLITSGVPLNCVVLHMVGLSRLILWILLIPCNLTNSLQFPPRLASPASPSSSCCWMTGNLRTLKCWTGGSGVSGVFVSNSAVSKEADVKAAWPVHIFLLLLLLLFRLLCVILSISWGHPLSYVLIQQAVGCWHTCERSFSSCEMALNALQVTGWGMTQRALFHYVGEKKQKPQQKQALNSYREAWNRQKLILKACIAWKNRKETALRSRQTKQNSCTGKHFLIGDIWRHCIVGLGHVAHRVRAANLELI